MFGGGESQSAHCVELCRAAGGADTDTDRKRDRFKEKIGALFKCTDSGFELRAEEETVLWFKVEVFNAD